MLCFLIQILLIGDLAQIYFKADNFLSIWGAMGNFYLISPYRGP